MQVLSAVELLHFITTVRPPHRKGTGSNTAECVISAPRGPPRAPRRAALRPQVRRDRDLRRAAFARPLLLPSPLRRCRSARVAFDAPKIFARAFETALVSNSVWKEAGCHLEGLLSGTNAGLKKTRVCDTSDRGKRSTAHLPDSGAAAITPTASRPRQGEERPSRL
ncbi:hypothetical protein SKAU_G00145710 [Synaphobranchus kaupii]|uniref:Uncharacterized protein n=1 Tax=Synaphobranchus kaupii TaxID=118154 RepID=A0A9Q1FT66_SYNKA|nr:hypothetical protein SKAU_G00145710 [Synaphobranchus kaupii]